MSTEYEKVISHLVYCFLETAAPWIWSAGRFDGVTKNGFSNKGDLENVGAPFLVSTAQGLGWNGAPLPASGSGGPPHRPAAVPGCGQGAGLGLEANKQGDSCAGLCPLPSVCPPLLTSQSRTPVPCSSPRPPPYFPCTSPGSTEADLSFPVFKTGIETMPA